MLRIRGLPNLGNTCYQNAALQLLFSIPEFSLFLSTKPMKDSFDTTGSHQWLGDLLDFVYLYHNSDNQSEVDSVYTKYYQNICLNGLFRRGQQEDSGQVLTATLLNSISDQYLEYPVHLLNRKSLYPEINPITYLINQKYASHFFDNGDANQIPPRPRLLGSRVTTNYELFLPLLEEGTNPHEPVPVNSLERLFINFRKVELEQGVATDPTIKRKTLKRMFQNQVAHADKYFFLRLGREDPRIVLPDGNFGKLTYPVKIPHLINIRHLVNEDPHSNPDSPSKHAYALVGVLHHIHSQSPGVQPSLRSGHYTASVLHQRRWHYCDDATVRPMSRLEIETLANSSTGYIYLFKRLDGLTTSSAERLAPFGIGIGLDQISQLNFVGPEFQFPFVLDQSEPEILVSDDEFRERFNDLFPVSPTFLSQGLVGHQTAEVSPDGEEDGIPPGF